MADGPSTAVVTLSVMGLAFDLIGAFLLSIPMVWSAKEAAGFCRRIVDRTGLGHLKKYMAFTGNLIMIVNLIGLPFILWPMYEMSIDPANSLISMYFLRAMFWIGVGLFVWAFVDQLFTWTPVLFWVLAKGNHDKRFGALGLILLSIGFILQFIVNMQWVH
jgi:hypothetical protein